MATACRLAAPLGLAPLPRGRPAAAVFRCSGKVGPRISVAVVRAANGTSGGEGSAETPEIVKAVQDAWAKVEDKYAVATIGFASLVGLWTAVGALKAIDKLPILPGVFELVGIGYTGPICLVLMQWFAYRNLIFQPDREALISNIKSTYNEITGNSS
ncbi:protein CURVATURE THYLAKOID 1B, chloroplastic isoform X1 [Brachypodium distachyon]|uniref:protein CURVATURE THYLAKOID 1B, chloroplastic isoform X1 n=1 Tax=Brachypodium distachyon TaxID=15368 RepID=UPI00071CEE8C|nr:protein CURVATURE THYLAKOID 1B, chloroplastic isoform X1 [Brachypodium distachyon]|eukprot:XP_014752218.1 protein CURVATURE THYLAKOID 1B, chloroplastic isoform X1 [Brachypodium distachyon]